ncbi:hypothetical protein MUP37_00920 [Candidatus Bathyarchaeota archaeon]|nr:hypothetical protein [Candidatus Bathyarchaeota archaeon]
MVPAQIFDLRNIGAVGNNYGSFEHLLLDILHVNIEALKEIASFAEQYRSYNEYAAYLRGRGALASKEIDDVVQRAREEKKLEEGRQLLEERVDSQKLDAAQAILEKFLKE